MVSEKMVGVGFVVAAVLVLFFLPALTLPESSESDSTLKPTTNVDIDRGLGEEIVSEDVLQDFSVLPEGVLSPVPSISSRKTLASPTLTARRVSVETAREEGFSFCGDSVCDASESCSSCQADCGCLSEEFCASSGVCQAKEFVGDGICTAKEKKQGVCVDCGCVKGSLCNFYSNSCIAPVKLTQAKAKAIVDSYLKQNPSYSLAGISDTYFGEEAVKEISFDCSKNYYCRVDLLVNATGNIIETLKTT